MCTCGVKLFTKTNYASNDILCRILDIVANRLIVSQFHITLPHATTTYNNYVTVRKNMHMCIYVKFLGQGRTTEVRLISLGRKMYIFTVCVCRV